MGALMVFVTLANEYSQGVQGGRGGEVVGRGCFDDICHTCRSNLSTPSERLAFSPPQLLHYKYKTFDETTVQSVQKKLDKKPTNWKTVNQVLQLPT